MSKVYDKASLIEEVLERYAAGEKINHICKDEHMPNFCTVYNWRRNIPEFGAAMDAIDEENCARQEGVHKSTGWIKNKLPTDEHTPDFPEPQGPNCADLIRERHERHLQSRQDEFESTTLLWEAPQAGKTLNFNK